jgi:sucrose phosphorylase
MYPESYQTVYLAVERLIEKWRQQAVFPQHDWVNNSDVVLITYGDALRKPGEAPLASLKQFMDTVFKDTVSVIHLLPMFPWSSDDGFSVIDYRTIDEKLGTWDNIEALKSGYDLMFDAVINHCSRHSHYFTGFLAGDEQYRDFFIDCDPAADYSAVIRPRALPLLTPVETAHGVRCLWTTFSEDQIDFNYKNPAVLLEMLDVLLFYTSRGARFIRFDAIGFVWKELGTSCMHLSQVHQMIKLMRVVLQTLSPGVSIITETNVPHKDNISYFGNGHDEAALVYQFPLPPLVLFSFLQGDATHLSEWAAELEMTSEDTSYFNFLASHDGIGLRPIENILSPAEQILMVTETLKRGGQIGYRALPDGTDVPYELNINYLDAIAGDEANDKTQARKFMASQCILLSVMGIPAIYYHSLFGSRGDPDAYKKTGIKRRINREKLDVDTLSTELCDADSLRGCVAEHYKKLINLRKTLPAFHPNSPQTVLRLAPEVFALRRGAGAEQVLALINVSGKPVQIHAGFAGIDRISGEYCGEMVNLLPWQYRWIQPKD